MGAFIDLTGKKFNHFTVIERAEDRVYPNGRRVIMWKCQCDCGNEKICIVTANNLTRGHTKSCGHTKKGNRNGNKHGLSHTPIYKEWAHMKQRCHDPNHISYKWYGGRTSKPIIVCDRWENSVENFFKDVSKLPHFGEVGYTLDRIDVNGDYEPNNVRWATQKQQSNNKRNNRLITYNGKNQTISQWADEFGINYQTICSRLKRGWDIEKVLTTPIMKNQYA